MDLDARPVRAPLQHVHAPSQRFTLRLFGPVPGQSNQAGDGSAEAGNGRERRKRGGSKIHKCSPISKV